MNSYVNYSYSSHSSKDSGFISLVERDLEEFVTVKRCTVKSRLVEPLKFDDFGGFDKNPLINNIVPVQIVTDLICEAVDDMSCIVVPGDFNDEAFKSCSCPDSRSRFSSCVFAPASGLTELNGTMKPIVSELHPFYTDYLLIGGSGRGFRGRGRRGGRRNAVGRRKFRRAQASELPKPRIPKSLGRSGPVPTSIDLVMGYSSSILITNPVAAFTTRDFRINSPFSPDPLVAGSVTGLPSLAALYSMMRVINFRYTYSVVNIEPTNALSFYWTFKDTQPSLGITSYNKAVEFNSFSPSTPIRSLGGAGGNNRFIGRVQKVNPASVLGEPQSYFFEKDYTSSLTANPVQILWGSFVLMDENATTFLTTGVSLQFKFMYTVRFFSPSVNLIQFRDERSEVPLLCDDDNVTFEVEDDIVPVTPAPNVPNNPNDIIDTLVNVLSTLKT